MRVLAEGFGLSGLLQVSYHWVFSSHFSLCTHSSRHRKHSFKACSCPITQFIRLSSTGKPSVLLNLPQFHFTLTFLPLTFLSSISMSFPKGLMGKTNTFSLLVLQPKHCFQLL